MSLEKTANVSTAAISSSSDVVESGSMSGRDAGAGIAGSGPSCDARSGHVAGLFVSIAWRVLAAWLLGCFALFVAAAILSAIGNMHFVAREQVIWVSLASGLITLASLIPGLVIGRGVPVDRVAITGIALVATSSAMGIRSAGTVALFVACRYHFGEESLSIVFLVIGWYIFLTSIEVHGLARGLTSLDQVLNFGRRDS